MEKLSVPAMAFDESLVSRPATMDDLPAALELFNICSLEQVGFQEFERNDVETEWSTPGFNLETDVRIVLNQAGDAVGYIEVWDSAPHVHIYAWGRVHPDYRGTGLGTRLVWWSETRARQSLSKAPEGARVALFNHVYKVDEAARALFLARGYRLVRHFFQMEIELSGRPPAPQWPVRLNGEGPIQVRTLQPGEEVEVLHAVRDSFKDHWGHVDRPFEEERARWMHWIESDENHDPDLWFLARDGEEIAGMSLCLRHATGHPDKGWVEVLGVRRPWRRRGLGFALLQHSFNAYYQRGMRKVGLGVDAKSLTGATRLYEKAGMKVVRQSDSFEKELRAGEDLSTQEVGLG